MPRYAALLSQIVLALFGVAALAFLVWEPNVEGRNAHATLLEVYFQDPVLAYAYLASVPFFVGLFQAIKLMGYAGRRETFSADAEAAVRRMKWCAIAVLALVVVSVSFMVLEDPDDRPAGVFLRLLVALPATVVAIAAALWKRKRRSEPRRPEEHEGNAGVT